MYRKVVVGRIADGIMPAVDAPELAQCSFLELEKMRARNEIEHKCLSWKGEAGEMLEIRYLRNQ